MHLGVPWPAHEALVAAHLARREIRDRLVEDRQILGEQEIRELLRAHPRFDSRVQLSVASGPVERFVELPCRIFRYLNTEEVYICPTHRLIRESDTSQQRQIEHRSSYTAPTILSGAPPSLLKSVRYPNRVLGRQTIPRLEDAVEHMMPAIVVEEDARWYLVRSTDSAWANWDQFTKRHRGKGAAGFVDGHAELRKFPSLAYTDSALTSWHLLYELVDGRIISAGHWNEGGRLGMGWLREAPSDF